MRSVLPMSGIPLFSKGQVRQRASSPKLVLWNNALVSALAAPSFEQAVAAPDWWGRLVENAAGAHLINNLAPSAWSVNYWRLNGEEVDFVVARGPECWAVEVRSGRRGKSSGLGRFRRRYPEARALLVGGEGMPLSTFFATPPAAFFA